MNSISNPSAAASLPRAGEHRSSLAALWPDWASCMAIAALWLGATAWLRPLAIPDEGRYVGVAWEMLRSGNWLVPTLDGMPFFHKPPLFYWITAASMQVVGPGVAAARMAAWLASVVSVTGLFAFTRRWFGARQAWLTVIVLMTAPLFYGAAQYANLDLLVAACISSTILLGAHATMAREAGLPHRRALVAAFVAAAFGVLAKGLIGVVVPMLVLLTWGLATRRPSRVLALLLWAPGWVAFAAVTAPWFIAMQARFPDFAHYFFVVQHLQRFASTGFNNSQPAWFYPAVLVVLTLPWSPWLLALLYRRRVDARQADVRMLMTVWVAVVTVFFSLPNSKLIGYILPALAPLAWLVAHALGPVPKRARWSLGLLGCLARQRRAIVAATAVFSAAGCVALTVVAHFHQPKSQQALAEHLRGAMRPGEPVVFLGNYYYDVAFYARLETPAFVVDPWLPAETAKDSWRRELVDAERFLPAGSTHRLLHAGEMAALLCEVDSAWVVGPWPAPGEPRWLAGQMPAYQSGETALWHLVRPAAQAALACPDAGAPTMPW